MKNKLKKILSLPSNKLKIIKCRSGEFIKYTGKKIKGIPRKVKL